MKKIFLLALMFVMLVVSACGNEKSAEQPAPEPKKIDAVLVAGSFWVIESENMPLLTDALNRNDSEYLNQLILEEKVFRVENNTKVICVGEATPDGNLLIQFKEGRYTNKEGRTFPYNVFKEIEFPNAYFENQKQAPLQLVQSALANTENYFDFIKAEDVGKLNQMLNFCIAVEKSLGESAEDVQINLATRNYIKDARKIIVTRGAALLGGLKIVENKQAQNNYQQKLAVETTYSFCKDELQLRQMFRDKYGF